MAALQYADLMSAAPGTPAGRYLRRFWQPVFLSANLKPGVAKPITVMNENFALFRGESGKPFLIDARCSHRGVHLGAGWVEGESVRCMYHGWMFDGSGRCVEQPAEVEAYKDKCGVRGYPVQEYLGLIFAYLGEGAPPPLPRYPWLEEEGVLESDTYVRPATYFYTLDNHSDEVHVVFAHRNTAFTRVGLSLVPVVEAEETEYGIKVYAKYPNGKARANQLLMPNILMFKSSPSAGDMGFSDRCAWRVPLDDNTHLSFGVDLRHLTGAAAERYRKAQAEQKKRFEGVGSAETAAREILDGKRSLTDPDILERPDLVNIQDNVAQMSQAKVGEPFTERLGRSDRGITLFRNIWIREVQAMLDGAPLKAWQPPAALTTKTGIDT